MIRIILLLLIVLNGSTKNQLVNVSDLDGQNLGFASTDSTNEMKNSSVNRKNIVNEKSSGDKGLFYLGMTFNDVNSLDLYNTDNEITEIKVIEDNINAWDYGHKVIWTPNLCLIFDSNGILYRITVNSESVTTSLGLKNGDPINVLEKLYGKGEVTNETNGMYVEEYKFGDTYFFVNISNDKVDLWGISKYKYDYNGNSN